MIRWRLIPLSLLVGVCACLSPAAGADPEPASGPEGAGETDRPRGFLERLAGGTRDSSSRAAVGERGTGDPAEAGGDRGGGLFSRFRRGARPPAGQASAAPEILASRDALSVEDRVALLDFHNQARREVDVPPLKWNPALAGFAQEWADEIARSGEFRHRPRSSHHYGENLAAGSAGAYTPVAMARQWYEGRSRYRAGTAIRTGSLAAGHYTQMVWRGSAEMGAGIAVIQKGPRRGMLVLVCNYDPPGNVVGEAAY